MRSDKRKILVGCASNPERTISDFEAVYAMTVYLKDELERLESKGLWSAEGLRHVLEGEMLSLRGAERRLNDNRSEG